MSPYQLPDLAYDYDALEPAVDARIMELHHGKHHAGYVAGANTALERLEEARAGADFSGVRALQQDLAFNLSGHVLHSLLWECLSPDGGGEPDGALGDAVEEWFGGYTAVRAHVTAAAASVQGSGWAAMSWEPLGRRLIVEQIHDHHGNVGQATVPLLVVDAWEHAWYLQHENDKNAWFEAFWNVVDWSAVAAAYERGRS